MSFDHAVSAPHRQEPRGLPALEASRGYVLAVVGDRDLREGMAELLRLEGFFVVGVEDGLDALLQLFTGEPLPDVVVFDADGPGMSGEEFQRLVRRNAAAAEVPFVLLG